MENKKQKTEEQKTKKINFDKFIKIVKMPQFNLAVALVLFILLTGAVAFPKYNEYISTKADLQNVLDELDGNNESGKFFGLRGEFKKYEAQYSETKKSIDKLNAEKQAILDFIFPAEEKINFLTQLLERYAIDHDSTSEPFQLTNISFAKAQPIKVTTKKGEKPKPVPGVGHSVVKINLPIIASEKNFEDFIDFIQKSGSLDPEDFYGNEIPVPLMTIESLSFSYSENQDQPSKQLVNASFTLNTYIYSTNNTNVSTTK